MIIMSGDFSKVTAEMEKYERFVNDINKVLAYYESLYPELVEKVLELRVNRVKKAQSVVLEIDPNSADPLKDLGSQQLLKKTWRALAQKTHPDHGGDSSIFIYARLLYKSGDLKALNALLESVNNNDFQSYLSFVSRKLASLYEVQKATLGYRLLCLHRQGKFEECKRLMKSTLELAILRLSTSLE